MKKLTPWYPSNVKPARPGVYQRRISDSTVTYAFFTPDGFWTLSYSNIGLLLHAIETADLFNPDHQSITAVPWRGLAEEPK